MRAPGRDPEEKIVTTADRVEREILIEAPVEVVWDVITQPDQISQWWADSAEIDLRPGGEGTMVWGERATTHALTVRIAVELVERPHRFSFRWLHPEGVTAHAGNSALVEFSLTAEDQGTRLRVVESGLLGMGWSQEQIATYRAEHGAGWTVHLGNLRQHVLRSRRPGL
jgi:uncharacterized protein YndB with AHSA1/START domain